MKIIKKPEEMQKLSAAIKLKEMKIGFVPTMGALHEGHLSLVKEAKKQTDFVVVSIFVNPIQFGPKEDYKKYPRDLKRDIECLKRLKVDVVFAPKVNDMFSKDFGTFVEVPSLSSKLCGISRPGHFKGVTTVVAKLFNIVKPDLAFFGLKDFQQQLIIRKMVKDLNFDVKIVSLPIVREKDGLAMSSRNLYLSQEERQSALSLSRSLDFAEKAIKGGEKDAEAIKRIIKNIINKEKNVKIDYVSVTDPKTLDEVKKIRGNVLIALAVYVGGTRLIDNKLVKL